MKRIIAVLALALATLIGSVQAEPKSLSSLQPFTTFKKGEGEGVAYEYRNRTKVQFVALLRDKKLAKKEMRVTCEVLVRQMMEAHPGLPFEGCEGAAAAIEPDHNFAEPDNKFSVIPCRDEMFQRDNLVTVTNKDGSAFGVWHRKCLAGEKVLTYKGRPLISLMCLNPAVPKASPTVAVAVAPVRVIGSCPDVYVLKTNVWQRGALKLPGVERATAIEEYVLNGFANANDFSRKHGGQVRKAYANGDPNAKRSETARTFRISLIMTPEAAGGPSTITSEEVLGDVTATGLHELRFTRVQLERWDAIRTVAIDGGVISPPAFTKTGLHELRFFNRLPNKKFGEWDNNPVPDCVMNQHAIE